MSDISIHADMLKRDGFLFDLTDDGFIHGLYQKKSTEIKVLTSSSDNIKKYWDTEEFEELTTKALISQYEKRIPAKIMIPNLFKIGSIELSKLKNCGTYISPLDRVLGSFSGHIDSENDGILPFAYYSLVPQGALKSGCYLQTFYLKQCLRPKKIIPIDDIRWNVYTQNKAVRLLTYVCYEMDYYLDGGFYTGKKFIIIEPNSGTIIPCYGRNVYNSHSKFSNDFGKEPVSERYFKDGTKKNDHTYQVTAAIVYNMYADKKYLWNVLATEGKKAKVLFGVYPEQIQSLFYARSLPLSVTGRKRPILHWVESHKRRMKAGTEIDINKHLRGITKFDMDGTTFEITNPEKMKKDACLLEKCI